MSRRAVLLAASPGGHLAELEHLAPRLVAPDRDRIWAVHESAQVEELLAGERLLMLPYTAPRDTAGVIRNASRMRRAIAKESIGAVLTTGAGVGLSAILAARTWGRPAHFVELAARSDGPSLTGQIASWMPGVSTLTQYAGWNRKGWRYCGSIFDAFTATVGAPSSPGGLKVFVTVGLNSYPFTSMLRAAEAAIPPHADIIWQTGTSVWAPSRGRAHETLGSDSVARNMQWADVVISHAGTGSCLAALEGGKQPILIPRRASRQEHVDDHQMQIALDLRRRGVAEVREPHELTEADVRRASRHRVARTTVEPLQLTLGGLS